jgi:hypothetical protein
LSRIGISFLNNKIDICHCEQATRVWQSVLCGLNICQVGLDEVMPFLVMRGLSRDEGVIFL